MNSIVLIHKSLRYYVGQGAMITESFIAILLHLVYLSRLEVR